MAKAFAAGFQGFNTEYQRINNNISKRCKAVERHAKSLAHAYFALSTELDNLQVLVRTRTDLP